MSEIKEWIADAGEIQDKSKKRASSVVTFEVIEKTDKDFVVERASGKNGKKKEYLVVMPSENVFYIKKNTGTIVPLSTDNLKLFFKGHPEEFTIDVNWLKTLYFSYGNYGCIETMVRVMTTKNFLNFVKFGDIIRLGDERSFSVDYDRIDSVNFEQFKKIVKIAEDLGYSHDLVCKAARYAIINDYTNADDIPSELTTVFDFCFSKDNYRYCKDNDLTDTAFEIINEYFNDETAAETVIKTLLSVPEVASRNYSYRYRSVDGFTKNLKTIFNISKKNHTKLNLR
jgi:hypothetical protein